MTERDLTKKTDDAFSAIIGFIADPVVVMDSSGRIVASNPIVEQIIDVKAEDFINKNFFEQKIFDEKQTLLIKENLKKRLSGSSIAPYRVTLRGKNGKEILLEVNAKIVEYNGQVLDVVVFHDVTGTKKMRTALRSSEERFNGIARSIKDPLIIVNEDAKVTYWNPAAEITFGYTSDEALGRVIHELVVPKSMCKEGKDRILQSVKTFSETGMRILHCGKRRGYCMPQRWQRISCRTIPVFYAVWRQMECSGSSKRHKQTKTSQPKTQRSRTTVSYSV